MSTLSTEPDSISNHPAHRDERLHDRRWWTLAVVCFAVFVTMLDGTTATFDDPLVRQPLSYVVVAEAEIAREREQLLSGPTE